MAFFLQARTHTHVAHNNALIRNHTYTLRVCVRYKMIRNDLLQLNKIMQNRYNIWSFARFYLLCMHILSLSGSVHCFCLVLLVGPIWLLTVSYFHFKFLCIWCLKTWGNWEPIEWVCVLWLVLVYVNDQWLSSRGLDILRSVYDCACIAVGIGKSIEFIEFQQQKPNNNKIRLLCCC